MSFILNSYNFKKVIRIKLKEIFKRYTKELNNPNLNHLKVLEAPNIVHYSNQDSNGINCFGDHCDTWDMKTASRQLSFIFYLNDVEEGGKTTFTDLNLSVKPKKGRVLL